LEKKMDAAAIAKAVQTEIERQQTDVVYNDLSVEELEGVVQHLSARLELCKEALATKQGGKKPEVAALVAKKSVGSWPDLPWTDPKTGKQDAQKIHDYIVAQCKERIMVIDGAMGTTVQQYKFSEEDFRGEMFKDCPETQELKGNNDLLVFTQPDTIREIHRRYFECGADICETNTFSGTVIAQADYGMEHVVYDLNKIGCELAVDAAKEITASQPHRHAWSPGPWARPTAPSPSRPRSRTRASVTAPGTRWCLPTSSRSKALSTAARTSFWSRPSSTRSTPRRRYSPSTSTMRSRAARSCL
jgi:5-methyltetrahydrofolate--homocysteine methyltransferase